MKTSKGHHTVEVLDGDAAGVEARGRKIEDLGEQMIGAAGILRAIGEGATVQTGKSIEKIKDEVGDVHEELKKAGDRYKPTGTAMKKYGASLKAVQDEMKKIVAAAIEAKKDLDAANSAASTANSESDGNPDPDPQDPAAVQKAKELDDAADTANRAVTHANTALEDQFTLFDTQWDIWDKAYDSALDSINDATDGNVSDGWTDNLAGVVDVVLTVLTWVGLALTVLALIVGGPIIAAIAAIVALVVLAGTIFLYFKGRKTGADVGWAILGVLPFGKIAKVFQKGSKLTALKGLAKAPLSEISTPISRIRALRGLKKGIFEAGRAKGMTRVQSRAFARQVRSSLTNTGGRGLSGVWPRISGGSNRAYAETFAKNFASYSGSQGHILQVAVGGGPLRQVVLDGGQALTRSEMGTQLSEFAVKKGRTAIARYNDISNAVAPDPVDQWRREYA